VKEERKESKTGTNEQLAKSVTKPRGGPKLTASKLKPKANRTNCAPSPHGVLGNHFVSNVSAPAGVMYNFTITIHCAGV
jgi:hypothetical protein